MSEAGGGQQEYFTSDDQTFKTTVEMGGAVPRNYTLEELLTAEARVIRGTNKNLQTALNSIVKLKKHGKTKASAKLIKELSLDEYGLEAKFFSEQQILFIKKKIEEYEAVYDTSDPFSKETIVEMAKNRLKTAEVEMKMLTSDNPNFIKQKTDLRKDFSSMAGDLKILPSQKKTEDRSKGRTSLAEIVMRYEARKKLKKKETSEKTKEMEKMLSHERVKSLDPKYDGEG